MSEQELQAEIDRLKEQVAELQRQSWRGEPRLGPRPDTQADVDARADRLIEALKVPQPVEHRGPQICTTNGKPVAEVRARQTNDTGQHEGYIVLCPDERAKGFIRPYRNEYRHTVCGGVTKMGQALSETYARDPKFYSATFCCRCNTHQPVAEFTWTADGQQAGS